MSRRRQSTIRAIIVAVSVTGLCAAGVAVSMAHSRVPVTVAAGGHSVVATQTSASTNDAPATQEMVVVSTQPPMSFAPVSLPATRTPVADDVAVQEAVAGVDPGIVLDARLGGEPAAGAARAEPGKYLYITVAIPSDDSAIIASEWEADLVQGAVAERISSDGNLMHAIEGSVQTGQLPDGKTVDLAGGASPIAAGQQFTAGSDADVVAGVDAMLEKYTLSPVTVRVLHPLSDALYIVADVSTAVLSSGQLEPMIGELHKNLCCEGFYLELRTPDAQAAVRTSHDARTGAGRFWTRPGLEVNIGIEHG